LFSLEFWLFVSLAAVAMCGLKIMFEASGSPLEGIDQPTDKTPRTGTEDETRSNSNNVDVASSDDRETTTQSRESVDNETEWMVIASAGDRETAYEVLAYLNERGIDAGIREGTPQQPYLEGRSIQSDIPVQIKKGSVDRAMECLQQSDYRETLLVEP
jgi:hypothetical protein